MESSSSSVSNHRDISATLMALMAANSSLFISFEEHLEASCLFFLAIVNLVCSPSLVCHVSQESCRNYEELYLCGFLFKRNID